jgi:hypothetical protein
MKRGFLYIPQFQNESLQIKSQGGNEKNAEKP